MLRCAFVDDDRWAFLDMRDSFPLAKFGYGEPAFYPSAEEALEGLRLCPVDLLITDICMRSMSGLELIARCKQEKLATHFIIVSGHNNFSFAQEAINQGADYYLLKPVNPEEAAKALAKACGQRSEPQTETKKEKNTFESILAYLNEHYAEPITLSELAAQFFINMNYLSELFSDKTGKTFSQYRNHLRITRAKALLDSGWNVNDAAEKVGYEDARYFSRVFHQMTGLTPTEYKKKKS